MQLRQVIPSQSHQGINMQRYGCSCMETYHLTLPQNLGYYVGCGIRNF